jgi:hypothetical protein
VQNDGAVVDEIARERQGKVLVAKLDTDRSQTTSMLFNIRSIPTTIVFKAGKKRRARQERPKKGLERCWQRGNVSANWRLSVHSEYADGSVGCVMSRRWPERHQAVVLAKSSD